MNNIISVKKFNNGNMNLRINLNNPDIDFNEFEKLINISLQENDLSINRIDNYDYIMDNYTMHLYEIYSYDNFMMNLEKIKNKKHYKLQKINSIKQLKYLNACLDAGY